MRGYMYICVYVHIYVCIDLCMCLHIYVYLFVYVCEWFELWTLKKRIEKKLDGNSTRMLQAILNNSCKQHPNRCTATYLLSLKASK